jgi:hypothetical protein
MRCYDCATEAGLKTEASASCAVCGAGLCLDHAIAGYSQESITGSLGNPAVRQLPGRRIFCRTCTPDHLEQAPNLLRSHVSMG